jgi:hypothetical protein
MTGTPIPYLHAPPRPPPPSLQSATPCSALVSGENDNDLLFPHHTLLCLFNASFPLFDLHLPRRLLDVANALTNMVNIDLLHLRLLLCC